MTQTLDDALAIHGGSPSVKKPFKRYNSLGEEEVNAACEVVRSGNLSQFLGSWGEDFFGGPKVQEFESLCQDFFGVKNAVSVNSWTSGLIAAVGALGIEPGDEVIVPPFTMCASATSILHWNAIPVFADIEADTFCLDLKSVEANLSPATKAIMAVDIFGHPTDMEPLMDFARENGLQVITDTAQSPGALYKGKYAGTCSDVGGYSLNYHKHIHTGEGGILVTDDDEIADRLRLIRNHAEAVVEGMGKTNLSNMIGYNFRLGEIECAIGIEQLSKLPELVARRQSIGERLSKGLCHLNGLQTPMVRADSTHAYYAYPMVIDVSVLGVNRERLVEALSAEGVPVGAGYVNVHLLPIFQQKIAFGSHGFPWSSSVCRRDVDYSKGICPVAEWLHDSSYIDMPMCLYDFDDEDVDAIVTGFNKVWDKLESLR